jgi:hypothetical protein
MIYPNIEMKLRETVFTPRLSLQNSYGASVI